MNSILNLNLILNLILAGATLGLAHAQVVLIGPGVRNGDFDDDTSATDQRTFAETPSWENIAGDQSPITTRLTLNLNTGVDLRNAQLNRAATQVLGQSTAHTIVAGDTFSVSYWWRDAYNWNDGADFVRVNLFTTDDDTITGVRTTIATTDSALSTTNNTYEEVDQDDFYTALPADVGKVLFVDIDTAGGDTNGFARIDDFELILGAPASDPVLAISSGNFVFGNLHHNTGVDSTLRTMTLQNLGPTNPLTIDAVSLTNDAGGIFSVTSAPAASTIIPVGGTFDVEVTATGGDGYTAYIGELLIDTTPDDQDTTVPVSATISTTGDPFPVISNGSLDNGLANWSGTAVSVNGMVSGMGARVRGIGDNRLDPGAVFADNLNQAFSLGTPDFTLTCSFAIPDFFTWTTQDPFANSYDRSFHLAVLASATTPGNAAFDSGDNANTLINLIYFPVGTEDDLGTTTPAGFHLYNGATGLFEHLPVLGTLTASVDADENGALETGTDTLNVYQLTITGTGFGTTGASYDISITDPAMAIVSATGLTTSHGADITAQTAQAVVFTTNDSTTDSVTNPAGTAYQPSFWVDEIDVSNGLTLPVALLDVVEAPPYLQLRPKSRASFDFTLGNVGLHEDLTIDNPVFSDPRFTLVSPAPPVSIAPGATQLFEVEFDSRASADTNDVSATLTADTNDGIEAQRTLDLNVRILPDGTLALIDYDDGIPGNGIHEASIRSGGFEDNSAGQTFAEADPWFSRFSPEGLDTVLILDSDPVTGSLHGLTSGWLTAASGDRTQPAQLISLEEWTLAEGDYFTVEITWKDGPIFDTITPAQLSAVIEIFNANGGTVNDAANGENNANRLLSRQQTLLTPGAFQTFSLTTKPIQPGSPWIGQRPMLRFLVTGGTHDRTHTALIDNVSLIAHVVTDQLAITDVTVGPQTGDATLRWNNTKRGYKIQSSNDITFATGTVEIPVDDLTADYTTYPGEVSFSFTDAAAVGPGPRFWRIVAE